ncbi:hypothetical protein N9V92_03460 [Luminiphilus sp.]|nr:hypothetical protein [Luminiphilus sp.]
MNKLLLTIILLFVSINGYANCMDAKPEEMSYYIYMEEKELHWTYCSCTRLFKNKMELAKTLTNIGSLDESQKAIDKASIISNEKVKISKVLKKDYGKDPEECK